MASFKLTKLEKHWIYYDIGNSAFTMLLATIIPIYFNGLAEAANLSSVDYIAYWGYAASIATLVIAVIGPVLGTLADTKGFKKPLFSIFLIIGLIALVGLGFFDHWLIFLIIFIVCRIGYSGSVIFYDSMLGDVTTPQRMDYVSSNGYAWGYIGSCIPFLAAIGFVLGSDTLGIGITVAMRLAFTVTALWWLAFSLPLLRHYKQLNYVEHQGTAFRESFHRLWRTLKDMRSHKKAFIFLLAFFFYIDGVYTIIDMATAYGTALGLDTTGLLLALLVTQIVAFPFAILFGRLSQRVATSRLITLCIAAYFGIAVFAMFLESQVQFWILAVLVGMFQGGIQALSRSYFARIIPPEQSGEYFGIMDICGKGASFMGTTLVSIVSQITGNISLGVGAIAILFLVGLGLFRVTVNIKN